MWQRLPWILIISVVIILVILAGLTTWLLQQKNEKSDTDLNRTLLTERQEKTCGIPSAESVAATEIIQISSTGFSASEVAIKVGQTVRWVNSGTGEHRVVVSPHPLHNDCIGLDSKELEPEQSFGFTFTKPGTWSVHDEKQLSNQATIVVTE